MDNNRLIRELVFHKITGYYAPGVDIPAALGDRKEFVPYRRLEVWDEFNEKYFSVIAWTIKICEEIMDV